MMGLAAAVLFATAADAAPVELRYDLRPGDHLVYRETLRRQGVDSDFETRAEWTSHVLVTGTREGGSVLGFQRNRASFDVVRGTVARRLPPERFAEANRVGETGLNALPWSALRESSSELLPALHEVEVLPAARVKVGDRWKGSGLLGFDYKAASLEERGGTRCLRIEGTEPPSDLRIRIWFGLETRIVERLEFEGSYSTVGARIHETLVFERTERRRGEDPMAWAADPETRQGALAAFLISEPLSIDPSRIHAWLAAEDPPFRRQVLAYCIRRRVPPPPAETLASLRASTDARIQALAAALEGTPLIAPSPTPTRFPEEPPGATLRGMTTSGFSGWPYVVHVPEDYRGDQAMPLLVSLSGGPGRALLGLPNARDEIERHGWLVVFPQAQDLWWSPKSASIVSTLLDEILRHFNVDVNRVYLTGSSNGGTGTFLYATLWPQRLAAAVSLMGAGVFLEPDGPLPANLNELPLLLAHGDKDPIIPIRASEETLKAVRRSSPRTPVEFKALTGRNHDLFLGNDDGLIAGFVEGRVRNPFPRRVSTEMRDLAFPRRYWVEILAKEGGLAKVDGEIDDHNRVSLHTKNVKRLRLLLRHELLPSGDPVRVTWNGKEAFTGPVAMDTDRLARTGQEAADPFLGWSMEVPLGIGRP